MLSHECYLVAKPAFVNESQTQPSVMVRFHINAFFFPLSIFILTSVVHLVNPILIRSYFWLVQEEVETTIPIGDSSVDPRL